VERALALIGKSLREAAPEVLRRIAVVAVVAGAFAGQQDMKGVVEVVVPLRAIFSCRRIGHRIEQRRLVGIVLEYEMNVPVRGSGKPADVLAQLMQETRAAGLGDCMHCVEPQPVEAVIA
jgi:hypothetical protein